MQCTLPEPEADIGQVSRWQDSELCELINATWRLVSEADY